MSQTVNGPDVAVVGFMPQIPDPAQQPAVYRNSAWPRAMDFLLKSGNPVPAIANYGDLQALINQQEFRVVVALRGVSVTWPDQTSPAQVQYLPPDLVPGYTPVRIWHNLGGLWQSWLLWYSRGVAVTNVAHSATQQFCTIELTVRVKLSWFMNAAQAILTWHLAPSAIVRVSYTLHRSGATQIEFVGSDIPSQQYLVGWNIVHLHDMCTITGPELNAFITAGNCLDAPISVKCTVP